MEDLMGEIKKHYEEKIRKEKTIPKFSVGDTVKVWIRVIEGNKSRLQGFQGVVIRKKGKGIEATFTVRRVSMDVGVERIFPLYGPTVEKVDVIKKGKVRREEENRQGSKKGKNDGIDWEYLRYRDALRIGIFSKKTGL
jgi:large subunit ribosomal protein L19